MAVVGAARHAEGHHQEDLGRDRPGLPDSRTCRRASSALEAEPLGNTPEQMREMIQQSLETWGPVVEAAKISVD